MTESIIIIGAGIAGLSAGCYAQMNGYQSRILDAHHSGRDVHRLEAQWVHVRHQLGAARGLSREPHGVVYALDEPIRVAGEDRTWLGVRHACFMIGQWTVPYAGMPMSAMSGRETIQVLCKRDRKRFVAHVA